MFINFLVALVIMIMISIPLNMKTEGINSSISDREVEVLTTVIDKAIISYYTNHSGNLPDELNENVLLVMGIDNIDLSKFIYSKIDDNTFRLEARLSSENILSANSDIDLIEIEPKVF